MDQLIGYKLSGSLDKRLLKNSYKKDENDQSGGAGGG